MELAGQIAIVTGAGRGIGRVGHELVKRTDFRPILGFPIPTHDQDRSAPDWM